LIRTLLKRLGSPYAISLRVWLWSTPIVVPGTALTFGIDVFLQYQLETWLLGLASHLLVGVLSVLASVTYMRKSKWTRPRPWLVLATYMGLGIARGLLISTTAALSIIPAEPDYFERTASATWVVLFWTVLLTLLYETSGRYHTSKGLLDQRIAQLQSLRNYRLAAVEQLRKDYLHQVEQTLAPALKQVRNAFDLEQIANTAIQPRSFGALELRVQKSQELKSKAESFNILQGLKATLLLPHNSVGVALLSIVALALPFVYQGGLIGATQLLVTFLAIMSALWLFQKLRNHPLLATTGILMLIGLSIASSNFFEASFDQGALSMTSLTVGNWLIAVSIMILSALDRQRDELASQLQNAVEELDSVEAKLRQELWLEHRNLDQLVHSEVQGRLRAAAVLAKTTGLDSDVEKLRRECISALTQGNRPQSLAEFQDELEVLWGHSLKLSFKISLAAKDSLGADPYLSNAVFLVVREGVINAVKHGNAKRVGISISRKGDQLLTVQVRNDGEQALGDRKGLGTELFEEVSQSWMLDQLTADTVLTVNLPVLAGTKIAFLPSSA